MMKDPFALRLLAILLGFLVDCVLGDPVSLPHPVIFIGKLISRSEKALRRAWPRRKPPIPARWAVRWYLC